MRNLRNSIFLAALILLGCVAAPSAHGQGSFPPTIYYNGATPLGPAVRYVCSTNLTCTLTNGVLTVTASSTASTSWPSITGSATNTNTGFVLAPTVTTSVLWTYNAATGQSADIVDFDLNSVKEVWIDSTGVLHLAQTGAFSTTGSAASLSISGQTGLLTFTGLTSTNRAITVRDAADTMLELGGSYTPTGTWNWSTASVTWPTFNQSTTGNAATATNLASYPALCTGSQFSQGLSSGSNNCATPSASTTGVQIDAQTATAYTIPSADMGGNTILSATPTGAATYTLAEAGSANFACTAAGPPPSGCPSIYIANYSATFSVTVQTTTSTWIVASGGTVSTPTNLVIGPGQTALIATKQTTPGGTWNAALMPVSTGGIANVSVAVTGATQGANSCSTPATVTQTGVIISPMSSIHAGYTADPASLTGWGSSGGMVFHIWPSAANTDSWEACNQTSASITYSSITFEISAR